MCQRRCLGLLLGAGLMAASMAYAQTITLEADYWMPYNGDGQSETGYMLDIAKAIFEPKGYIIRFTQIPWARALADARAGKAEGVVGAAFDDAPDFVYPAEEQGRGQTEFYVLAGNPWRYTGIPSLAAVRLAIARDYTYFPELDQYIESNAGRLYTAYGEDPLSDNIRLLMAGSVGALVDVSDVVRYTIAKEQLQTKIVSAGTGGEAAELFTAFAPGGPRSAEYAGILSDGMVALRRSGQLAAILARYGLTDWK